jgi:DNA polymerase III alpha subunit
MWRQRKRAGILLSRSLMKMCYTVQWSFSKRAKKNQMIGIIGLELDFYYGESTERVVLYAKNVAGYQELMRLSSTRMMAEKPLPLQEYNLNGENLITVLPLTDYLIQWTLFFQPSGN